MSIESVPVMPERKGLILAVVCIATYAVLVEGSIVNIALPSIVRQLNADTTELKWIVDAYNLVFAALVLVGGSLSDKFGRRRFLALGLVIFGIGNAIAALANDTGLLITSRGVMGLGAALVFPTTLSIITNTFTERGERAKAIGLWGAMTGLGVASGPIIGGWLLESFYWGSVFVVMVPAAMIGVVATLMFIPESRDPESPPIDWGGVALSTVALAALVAAIIQGPSWGWLDGKTLSGFGIAVVFAVLFIGWERKQDEPMLDVLLFKNARFSAASGSITAAFFALFGFIFLVTQYFQFVRGYGTLSSGLRTLPVAISIATAAITGTRLAVKYGNRTVVATGLTLMSIAFFWIAFFMDRNYPYELIVLNMIVMGLGIGFTTAPATESIMGAVSKEKAGQGSGVNDATREVGGTLGVAVIGSVYASMYASQLDSSSAWQSVPSELLSQAEDGVGIALGVTEGARETLGNDVVVQLQSDVIEAFIRGLSIGCVVAGVVTLIGAAAAARFLPARPQVPQAT
jgi:EmrB/QacA subfamily drug resistance transporter